MRRSPGSQSALGEANRHRVEAALHRSGEMSQADIARATGLAPATVSNIVRHLRQVGVVEVTETLDGRRRIVRMAATEDTVVGLDFGHRHVSVALAETSGVVLTERRSELPADPSADEALGVADRLIDELLAATDRPRSSVRTIGMGLPAPVSMVSGQVGAFSILPGWADLDAAGFASEKLGAGVHVDNDATLGAWAEHRWGTGQGAQNLAFIKLSEGVGGGLILDGRPFRGRDGTAGELGHTTIDDHGAVCRCGNRGCLETVAAARTVVELLAPHMGQEISIADVVAAASRGDHSCLRVLSDTGDHAGRALANLCNLFNPELIIIGGELAQAGELFLEPIRESVQRHAIPSATADLTISVSALGARASLLGAIALALEHLPVKHTG